MSLTRSDTRRRYIWITTCDDLNGGTQVQFLRNFKTDASDRRSVSGSHKSFASVGDASEKSSRSKLSATSRSQVHALKLVDAIEEDVLRSSLEQDRILAEQKLETRKIQKNLEMKKEQKTTEYLKRT